MKTYELILLDPDNLDLPPYRVSVDGTLAQLAACLESWTVQVRVIADVTKDYAQEMVPFIPIPEEAISKPWARATLALDPHRVLWSPHVHIRPLNGPGNPRQDPPLGSSYYDQR